MLAENNNAIKHAGVYNGIIVIIALLLGTGVCRGDVQNALCYICPAGFFLSYGVCFCHLEDKKIKDDSKAFVRFKDYLLPFFMVSICLCIHEAYMIIFGNYLDVSNLLKGVSDTMSLYGYGTVGLLSALFVAGYGYEILRSKFKLITSAVIIAACFSLFCFLYNNYFDITFVNSSVKYYFYMLVMAVAYRGLLGMIFVCIGEAIESLMIIEDSKNRPINRLFIAIIGVLIVICGVIVVIMNDNVSLCDMIVGNVALFVAGSVLMSIGLFLVCRWIGEGQGLEYLGKHFVFLFVIGSCLGGSYISRLVSNRLFEITNHDFVKNFSAIATMICIEAVALVINHFYRKIRRR